jgi:hypothetical protein
MDLNYIDPQSKVQTTVESNISNHHHHHNKGVNQNLVKIWSMCFVKRRFDRWNGNVWRIFPECSSKTSKHFLGIIKILLLDQSETSRVVSNLEFVFKKSQRFTFWLLNHCLEGKKWTGNNYLVKILLTGFKLKIQQASTHAFVRANRTTGRDFCKFLIFRVLHDFFH